jgi:hypothetical protein
MEVLYIALAIIVWWIVGILTVAGLSCALGSTPFASPKYLDMEESVAVLAMIVFWPVVLIVGFVLGLIKISVFSIEYLHGRCEKIKEIVKDMTRED